MSKQSNVGHSNVILYRLEAIERRLDNVEKHLYGKTESSPDIIAVLLEIIKNGNVGRPTANAANAATATNAANAANAATATNAANAATATNAANAATATNAHVADASTCAFLPTAATASTASASTASIQDSTSAQPASNPSTFDLNYDSLACMARRRTVV